MTKQEKYNIVRVVGKMLESCDIPRAEKVKVKNDIADYLGLTKGKEKEK